MQREYGAVIELFQYPAGPEPLLPVWDGLAEAGGHATIHGNAAPSPATHTATYEEGQREQFDQELAEARRKSFDVGRERGMLEGRQAEREAQAEAHALAEKQRTEQLAEIINGFAQERDCYFQAVEHEVVELALAIAARVLRREAQMDPLLLTGAVRVALGQLSESTQVRLRVPAGELDLWTEAIEHIPNLALKPAVVAGQAMRLGDCVLETELGSVDLGVRAQLGEIERGFFDRTSRRSSIIAAPAQHSAEAQP